MTGPNASSSQPLEFMMDDDRCEIVDDVLYWRVDLGSAVPDAYRWLLKGLYTTTFEPVIHRAKRLKDPPV
jgi:hypothetical protein